jgi:hypothetical protein
MVVLADGEARETSRAAMDPVIAVPGLRYHSDCYADRSQQSAPQARRRSALSTDCV